MVDAGSPQVRTEKGWVGMDRVREAREPRGGTGRGRGADLVED